MVAAFDPSNPKGIRIQWLVPHDELPELIDRLFMSHNRKLRGQSPRAKMHSLRKYFLLNWHHYFYVWWLESTLNRTAIKTHAKHFLITLQKRSGTGSRNGKQMGGFVAGVNRRIRANEFLRWYGVSIHIPLLLCISARDMDENGRHLDFILHGHMLGWVARKRSRIRLPNDLMKLKLIWRYEAALVPDTNFFFSYNVN